MRIFAHLALYISVYETMFELLGYSGLEGLFQRLELGLP